MVAMKQAAALVETRIRQQSHSPRIVKEGSGGSAAGRKPWSGATSAYAAYVRNKRRSVCANTESEVKEQGGGFEFEERQIVYHLLIRGRV